MPKGTRPAPPQQSTLGELWGKKKKREPDATVAQDDKMNVDKTGESSKRKQAPPAPVAAEQPPKAKRRRVVASDDEAELPSATKSEAAMSSEAEPVPPSDDEDSEPVKPKRKAASKAKGNDKVKAKPKAKTKPAIVEEDESDEPEAEASSASSGDEAPEEDPDEGEEEIDEEEATQNAATALSKTKEVDIEGGWKEGQPVPYAALAKVFALIESTTKRLEKTSLLTSFLLLVIQRSAPSDTESLLQAVYLCINRLCPDYVGIELGIGESLLLKAIAESTGRSLAVIRQDLKKEGDLGLVAKNSKNAQKTLFKPKPLTVPFVFKNLKEIASSTGHSSQTKKVSIITKLLAACQGEEAKYIIRSLEGKLRIGNAERTVLVALAHAAVLAEQEKAAKKLNTEKLTARLEHAAEVIKSVYSELPSYDLVIPALLEVGVDGLKARCKLTPGVPLKPMLAKPTKAIGEVLDRFEGKKFTCEYKYDGERAQVHKLEDGSFAVFSRNSEDMSKKYPDLMDQLPRCMKATAKSFVLDAEAVAVDRKTGQLKPFQELSKRKRKDVKVEDIEVWVCLFGFDLLYLNGESLLHRPFTERRELLREHFQEVQGEFAFAKSNDCETTEEIQTFLEDSVKDGCEGLMVKMLETEASHYEPSRRSVNWLKLKKDYLAGVGDSLDLAVVGGYYGKGKRTNVYGAFLLACYDTDGEQFQTICKIGTGFSDEALQQHYDVLKPLELTKPRGDIQIGGAKPDVWFEPKVVWEVLTADLSLSPVYTAAQGLVEDRGISLRFPRFIRVRDDKGADDATGPEQIAEMYERQVLAQNKGGKKGKGGDGDDGFW
ncbi:DNA ligase I [Phanerochaete sordida]|uniref:DNA ligase n=1 Tax=Phanerochaete sordida TaxID=48140 RepID=A0A9P3L9N3_9APHY|nr:DNA ligase I [Phanerochaete sordida]